MLVYNSLLAACASAGQWRPAVELLGRMSALSLEMDIFSLSSTINACEKGGEWQRALHLCTIIPRLHLAPNVVAVSSAMSACAKASRWQLSLLLLRSMSELRVQPNAFSFSAVMAGCQRVSSWHQSLYLLSRMFFAGLVPDVVSCNAAIEGLATWEVATHLVDEMEQRGIAVNELSFNTAISACSRVGQVTRVKAAEQTQSQSVSVLTNLQAQSAQKKGLLVYQPFRALVFWSEPSKTCLGVVGPLVQGSSSFWASCPNPDPRHDPESAANFQCLSQALSHEAAGTLCCAPRWRARGMGLGMGPVRPCRAPLFMQGRDLHQRGGDVGHELSSTWTAEQPKIIDPFTPK